jgi:hypothetical protein
MGAVLMSRLEMYPVIQASKELFSIYSLMRSDDGVVTVSYRLHDLFLM